MILNYMSVLREQTTTDVKYRSNIQTVLIYYECKGKIMQIIVTPLFVNLFQRCTWLFNEFE